jgi:hypothetical protein
VTRDNMKKRKWLGSPVCSFCNQNETATHLFFFCHVARCIWGAVGKILGRILCPNNVWQALAWIYAFLPGCSDLYMVGIPAVCWAIWKNWNKVTFDKHKMQTHVRSFFCFIPIDVLGRLT